MPTNNDNNIEVEVMDEKDLFEQYGYEAPEYDDMPVDPNELLAEDEYPECDVIFAEGPLPVAFQGAVVAPVETSEVKEAEQAVEDPETSEAEASEKEAQAAAIAELLARTEGAPRLSDTTEDFFSTPPVEWTVKGHVQVGGITVINGASFDGKSLLTIDMMASVITGTPWCGQDVQMGSVFYYDYDDAKAINVERFKAILRARKAGKDVTQRWHYISANNLGAITPYNTLFPDLMAREVLTSPDIKKTNRAVIVIDTLLAFCGAADINEATIATPAFKGFRRAISILADCGIKASVVVLHHYRKDTPGENKIAAKTFDKKITAVLSYGTNKSYGSNVIINNAEVLDHVVSDPNDADHKALVQTKNKAAAKKVREYLEIHFSSEGEGDTMTKLTVSGTTKTLYTTAPETTNEVTYSQPQAPRRPSVDPAEKVLQYVADNPGVGRFAVRNAGIVNTNSSKGIIDRLIAEGRLVEGASAGSARKGQGLYIA